MAVTDVAVTTDVDGALVYTAGDMFAVSPKSVVPFLERSGPIEDKNHRYHQRKQANR